MTAYDESHAKKTVRYRIIDESDPLQLEWRTVTKSKDYKKCEPGVCDGSFEGVIVLKPGSKFHCAIP